MSGKRRGRLAFGNLSGGIDPVWPDHFWSQALEQDSSWLLRKLQVRLLRSRWTTPSPPSFGSRRLATYSPVLLKASWHLLCLLHDWEGHINAPALQGR